MSIITLVTGNAGKLAEWQRLFPAGVALEAADIDLDEIQSLDLEAIVIDKAKRAHERIGKPVMVEDVSAGLVSLGGLPGPFIKYFEIQLGDDALFKLAGKENEPAVVTCTVAFHDGISTLTARADIEGTIVASRGDQGFGFDKVFVPKGFDKTFGEMDPEEKDKISHRSAAIKNLVQQLESLTQYSTNQG